MAKTFDLSTEATPCRTCRNMVCRTKGTDCYGVHDEALHVYRSQPDVADIVRGASQLIDDGRAGTLCRVEELVAFVVEQKYARVGIAACYGMKDYALELSEILEAKGVRAFPVLCTSGAVKERELDATKENEVVSCNPAGQAAALNRLGLQLVVETGLCLGHDLILHRQLQVPHTVLVVKDRKLAHNPAAFFAAHGDASVRFIEQLDDSFAMKSPAWLIDLLDRDEPVTVIDLRAPSAFEKGHIKGALNISLKDLPQACVSLNRELPVVCACNGSVQSAYAISFLYTRGFLQVYNLSGGVSRWEKEGHPLESSS